MEFWYAIGRQPEAVGSAVPTLIDLSGLGRNATGGNAVKQTDSTKIDNQPFLNFTGSNNHYTVASTAMTLRHVFAVAAMTPTLFANYAGLVSGIGNTENAILAGNIGSNVWFNGGLGANYKLNSVVYAETAMLAPMGGNFAIIEWINQTGSALTGLQIGEDRSFGSRTLNGKFVEAFGYSDVKDESQRYQIYQYFALNYYLWQKQTDALTGLNIFPFPTNHSRNRDVTVDYLESQPYSGNPQFVLNGTEKELYDCVFNDRHRNESKAAMEFGRQTFPANKFVFRDYRFTYQKDITCRMTTPVREQGIDGRPYYSNYGFSDKEV